MAKKIDAYLAAAAICYYSDPKIREMLDKEYDLEWKKTPTRVDVPAYLKQLAGIAKISRELAEVAANGSQSGHR